MSNPYIDYYKNQAGSGLAAFSGHRYQRGHGFFGSIFKNILKPLGKYLGGKALSTGVSIGNDFLTGKNIKESAKRRLRETTEDMLDDSVVRAKKFIQTGKGKRRRRRKTAKKSKKIAVKVQSKLRKKKSVKKKAKKSKRSFRKKRPTKSHLKHLF